MNPTHAFIRVPLAAALLLATAPAIAQDKDKTEAAEITSASQAALAQLYANVPLAKGLAPTAHAVLVFPKITKAGLGIGGQHGEGAPQSGKGARGTTRRPAARLASRPAPSNTLPRCSS